MEEEEEAPAITRNKFDEILTLYNLYWFHHLILFKYPPTPIPPPTPAPMDLSSQPNRHRRTHSDGPISTSLHPVKPPHLQIIPSGNYSLNITQSSHLHLADMDAMKRRRPPKSPLRRSKSELELEELQGLMDRGLKLSDTEVKRDSKLTDIVPELRKRRSKGKVKTRRYSSEWRPIDEEERRRVLGDWSVLTNGDEGDVKEKLRLWAHVVASSCPFGEG